jgi:hypothetical protein
MRTNLIVVDDFLDNAAELRTVGLRLNYPDIPGAYPGRNSLERVNVDGLTELVSRIAGEPLEPVLRDYSHGKFRIAMEGDTGQGDIHFDMSAHWSGVLFLSRPEDCRGGTEFFRHKASGTEQAPITREELHALGFDDHNQMVEAIVQRDGIDRGKWDLQIQVPMRFNRLVLFNSWLWHTAGPGFGTSPEDSRLIYLMFFRAQG